MLNNALGPAGDIDRATPPAEAGNPTIAPGETQLLCGHTLSPH